LRTRCSRSSLGAETQQAAVDRNGNVIGIERAGDRKQPVPVFVFLADANGWEADPYSPPAQLHFDQRTLFPPRR
jgi:hypothetical protein